MVDSSDFMQIGNWALVNDSEHVFVVYIIPQKYSNCYHFQISLIL